MKNLIKILLPLLFVLSFSTFTVYGAEVPKVIVDTDYASDADDVLALELAMVYDDADIIELLGVACSTTYSQTPRAINYQLSYHGYNIPVSMNTANGVAVYTDYVNAMNFGSSTYEEPTKMYRRLLASSEDKVSIVVLGFLTNIEDLLKSSPDEYSGLTGLELVEQKVDTIYIVGGNLIGRPSFNLYYGDGRDTCEAAKYVNKYCPCRIVWNITELGDDIMIANYYVSQDKKQIHPVTKALVASNQTSGVVAWDPFAIYCMVQDMYNLLEDNGLELKDGITGVYDNGTFTFQETDTYTNRQILVKHNSGGSYVSTLNSLLNWYFVY